MPRTFDDLLSPHSDDVRRLAESTRRLLRELLPSVEETIDSSGPYAFYGYGPGYKGMICSIIVSKGGVKLGLVDAAHLADPYELLEGAGKRHRHIAIEEPGDLRKPGVRDLVRANAAAWRERQSAAPPAKRASRTGTRAKKKAQ
jgi:hypothetical protein